MPIEQTTQLIQLILNAVLMLGACGMMLCAALMHQIMLENRFRSGNLAQRSSRHQRFRQQRQTRRSIFWLSRAGWVMGMSCGALVLRSVWQVNELIGLSLVLFAGACGLFLVGTGWLIASVMATNKGVTENPELVRAGIRSHHRSRNELSKRSDLIQRPIVMNFQARGGGRSETVGDRKRP